MTIIKLEPMEKGQHLLQSQSHRTECWEEGWIAVPPELEAEVWATCGYCELKIEAGRLVGITPGERPETPREEREPDELTRTQLALAELAGVVEENNTANQMAIAELAEALLGGEG